MKRGKRKKIIISVSQKSTHITSSIKSLFNSMKTWKFCHPVSEECLVQDVAGELCGQWTEEKRPRRVKI